MQKTPAIKHFLFLQLFNSKNKDVTFMKMISHFTTNFLLDIC